MFENDDIEFATKEDLELIQKDPSLQRVYNAMKAGVTKKFQEWAEKGKSIKAYEDKIRQLEDKLYEWEDWYTTAFPEGWTPQNTSQGYEGYDMSDKSDRNKKSKGSEPTISDIIEAVNKAGALFEQRLNAIESNYNKLSNAFTLSLELMEQKFTHPDMDVQKVLKTAMEKGLSDLGTAYEIAYKDDLVKKQIDSEVQKRLDEKQAELKKTLETGSGTTPLIFERPKDVPKSFTEATQQFLAERSKESK